jgi:hypothetical protein
MPRDPYIREKFTRERAAAKKLAAEYFQRFPKDRYQTVGRKLAPPAIAEYRIHHEAAAPAEVLMPWSSRFDDPISLPRGRKLLTLQDAGTYITRLPKAEHEAKEWRCCGACSGAICVKLRNRSQRGSDWSGDLNASRQTR